MGAGNDSMSQMRRGAAVRKRAVAAPSRWAGLVAALALAGFYVGVVRGASGSWPHLAEQARADWYLLVPIVAGFGVQVALVAELRRRRRLHALAAAAGGAGTGSSAAGMVACCAHHLADLAPFLGLGGAATTLYQWRFWFMLVGLGANLLGVAVAARRLRATTAMHGHDERMQVCAAA